MAECVSCKAPIIWARTVHGGRIPVDAERVRDGNIVMINGLAHVIHQDVLGWVQSYAPEITLWRSHFASCPEADKHRKREQKP